MCSSEKRPLRFFLPLALAGSIGVPAVAQAGPGDAIGIEAGALYFPMAAAGSERVELAEYESAFLSPEGSRALAFDRPSRRGRVFDVEGRVLASFETDVPYAFSAVSDAGLVFLASPATFPEARVQTMVLLDAGGEELWRSAGRFVARDFAARFSRDGERLAVMAPERSGDEVRLKAMLYDRGGEMASHRFDSELYAAAIAFTPDSKRVAFGACRQGGGDRSDIALWSIGDAAPTVVRCDDLGQPLDRGGLAFSANGRWLAVGGLARVEIRGAESGALHAVAALDAAGERGIDTAAALVAAGRGFAALHRSGTTGGDVWYVVHSLEPSGRLVASHRLAATWPRRASVVPAFGVRPDGRVGVGDFAVEIELP